MTEIQPIQPAIDPADRFWGMGIYQLHTEGTLSGEWNNNDPAKANNILHHEIARKENEPGNFEGRYIVSWIEHTGTAITGTLDITLTGSFTSYWVWRNEEKQISFTGRGMQIGPKKFAVAYWNPDDGPLTFNT